jgi:hypothetical protein
MTKEHIMTPYRLVESACFAFSDGINASYTHLASLQYETYRPGTSGHIEYFSEFWLVEKTTGHEYESFDTITEDMILNKVTNWDLVEAHAQFTFRLDTLRRQCRALDPFWRHADDLLLINDIQ